MSPKGTLLALCEAREGDDGDPTDLVLKRSLYDGRPSQPRQLNGYPRTFGYGINWLPMQVVLLNPLHPRLRPPPEPRISNFPTNSRVDHRLERLWPLRRLAWRFSGNEN